MENERTTYLLAVRPEPGVDEIRAMRAWLKIGLRTFGLRCVEVQESKQQRRMNMDMRKYSASVIRPDDLSSEEQIEKIVNIFEHEKHGCAVLEFDSGNQLYLWNNLARVLYRAWGHDSENWLEREVALSCGSYLDKKTGEQKACIVIRAVSPALREAKRGGMDDEIPF